MGLNGDRYLGEVMTKSSSTKEAHELYEKLSRQMTDAILNHPKIVRRIMLDYEMSASSWWVSMISNPTLQILTGKYFAWKVKRKFAKLKASKQMAKRVYRRRDIIKATRRN